MLIFVSRKDHDTLSITFYPEYQMFLVDLGEIITWTIAKRKKKMKGRNCSFFSFVYRVQAGPLCIESYYQACLLASAVVASHCTYAQSSIAHGCTSIDLFPSPFAKGASACPWKEQWTQPPPGSSLNFVGRDVSSCMGPWVLFSSFVFMVGTANWLGRMSLFYSTCCRVSYFVCTQKRTRNRDSRSRFLILYLYKYRV